ncbi:hypothetical protein ACFWHL_16330 [Streptomyces massasporeus]
METINVTVWTVMQGDEGSAFLRDLNVSRERAKKAFETAAAEIDDATVRLLSDEGLQAGNGTDWVRLEPRAMTVTLGDLTRAIAQASGADHPTP